MILSAISTVATLSSKGYLKVNPNEGIPLYDYDFPGKILSETLAAKQLIYKSSEYYHYFYLDKNHGSFGYVSRNDLAGHAICVDGDYNSTAQAMSRGEFPVNAN